ncbi:MAG: efflux RND transporter permease subunit, partial [Trueperaceae bacterium]|nr:efflux RND transporter permease subunit [Trueperaceae bacterium]
MVGDTTVFVENSVFDTVRETLLAIAVAVGLVVDDSIVIAENVERYRAMGAGLKKAVYKGAGEVAVAVLTATLSLLAVFVPIAFLPGVIGQFFSQFGLSLAATIVVSYLEAMFFLTVRLAYLPNPLPPTWRAIGPAAAALVADARWSVRQYGRARTYLLAGATGLVGALEVAQGALPDALPASVPTWLGPLRDLPATVPVAAAVAGVLTLAVAIAWPPVSAVVRYVGRLTGALVGALLRAGHEVTDAGVRWMRERYAVALGWVLDRANATLVVAALLVASLGLIGPQISFNFVSPVDAGQVAVRIEMPPGTPLDRTDAVAALAEGVVRSHPDVVTTLTNVGSGGTFGNTDAVRANLQLEMGRGASSFAVADELRPRIEAALAAFPEARVTVGADDGGVVPVATGLELTLIASDRALLEERDQLARDVMAANPWLRDVRSSLEGSVVERVFEVAPSA